MTRSPFAAYALGAHCKKGGRIMANKDQAKSKKDKKKPAKKEPAKPAKGKK